MTDLATNQRDMSSVYEHSCKVALNFVKQYYTMLHTNTSQLHRFYVAQSAYVHGGNEEEHCYPALGQKEIQEKVDSLGLTEVHTSIKQVDALPSGSNSILIQVTGEISTRGSPMRAFVQSFVLSQDGPKKYSIVADIFRYQEDVEPLETAEEISYPADGHTETVGSPESGDLVPQEEILSSQPPPDHEEVTEVPSVPAGSQPISTQDSQLDDWSMDADESYEPQNGPVEYPADETEDRAAVVVDQSADRDEDIGPDQQEPQLAEREVQETGGQRSMSYASISSIHVPPGAKVAEPRFSARSYVPKKKTAFQVSNPVAGRDTRASGPPMGPYRAKASVETNRPPRDQFQIFVGGLPKDCMNEELLECFTALANVVDVKIHHNGYGFVAFSSEEHVNKVMDNGPYQIRQNKIRVERKGSSGSKGGYARDVPPTKKKEGQRMGTRY